MPADMTDLEAVRLCAEAMGYTLTPEYSRSDLVQIPPVGIYRIVSVAEPPQAYWPLTDQAQAMALVKKFELTCIKTASGTWDVQSVGLGHADPDLQRAIVYCVAAMQRAKGE